MTRQELLNFHRWFAGRGRKIMEAKNHDYAGVHGDEPFANFTRSESLGICSTEQGFLVRMSDKLSRLATFAAGGKLKVGDETASDTLLDLLNYSVLLAGYLHEGDIPQEEVPLQDYKAQDTGEPLNIYISGPFSNPDPLVRKYNTARAAWWGLQVAARGHRVHIPHAATKDLDPYFDHDWFMQLDLDLMDKWADALFYLGDSKGALIEKEWAERHGMPVYKSLIQLPNLKPVTGLPNFKVFAKEHYDVDIEDPRIRQLMQPATTEERVQSGESDPDPEPPIVTPDGEVWERVGRVSDK